MLLLPKNKKRSFINKLIEKRNSFIRSETFSPKKALNFLNIAQFLGVINDNVFKFLTLFLLIDIQGIEASSKILFWVGTVYVLPFLFFSSAAGVLADKFSKQKIIVFLKAVEVLTTAVSILAFWVQSTWACYALLFLLALHSAAFGPPKYSIIPEIVPEDKISKANGLITSFTYLGVIVGTFLASFTTQITGRNFPLCATICFLIAICGLLASLLIPYTKPNKTENRIKFFFLKDVYRTLEFCYRSPHLLTCVLSAAFFLYLGAFFQLNIIPYAIQSLGLSEIGGGYLFLTVAIGIAIGAVLVGKLSKNNIELGFSCIAGLFLFILVFLLAISPNIISINVILLILIGCFTGFFIVPIDAYIQKNSPDEKRGQVVATSNFMSFTGVLLAPFSIYLLSGTWGFSAAAGFFFVSMIVFFVALSIIFKLSSIFFHFVGKKCFSLYYTIKASALEENDKENLIILENATVKRVLFLASSSDQITYYYLKRSFEPIDVLFSFFSEVHVLYLNNLPVDINEAMSKIGSSRGFKALIIDKKIELKEEPSLLENISSLPSLNAKIKKSPLFFSTHKKHVREIFVTFEKSFS